MAEKKVRELTVAQQAVEQYISEHEDIGEFLVGMGLIEQDEYDAGIAADEKFKLRIEADEALAEVAADKLDAGVALEDVEKAAG